MNYAVRSNRPNIPMILVIMFVLSLAISKCARSQSIGLDLITSQAQHYQPGISITGQRVGVYADFIQTESSNEDHYIHRGVTEYKGFVIGFIGLSNKDDHYAGTSLGVGAINTHYYDVSKQTNSWRFIGELRCNINICKGLDVVVGINTEPWIIYGVRIYAFK